MARVRPSAQTMKAECQVTGPGARKTRVGSPQISLSRVKVIQQSTSNSLRSSTACSDFFLDEGHACPPVITWRSA